MVSVQASQSGESSSADTFYEHDDKNRVRTVYPPLPPGVFQPLLFHYVYDARDNILQKKIPDQDTIRYLYNDRDLPTFMQHGNLN